MRARQYISLLIYTTKERIYYETIHKNKKTITNASCTQCKQSKQKMNKQLSIEQFTKNLFWDISPLAFDVEQCPAQIVERVLERGEWSDWCLIRDYFGLEQLAAICKTLRTMSPESLSYICCITNTRKEDYRCYHFAQSHQTLWNS